MNIEEQRNAPADDWRHPDDSRLIKRLVERARLEDPERTIIIISHHATNESLTKSLGFSPLLNLKTGARYGDANFSPSWAARDHDGFFEVSWVFGDELTQLTFVYFLWDDEKHTELAIREACREFASRAPPQNEDRYADITAAR